jgi:hypothetical protein
MMKKLLTIVLVLGLASVATAQPVLNLTVNGADVAEYTMTVGDIINIGINSDGIGGTNGKYSGALVINAMSTDTGTGIWAGGSNLYNGPGEPLEFLSGAAAIVVSAQVSAVVATNAVLDDYAQAGIGMDYAFECTGEGDVTIQMMNDVYGPGDILTIHQIPEPITFALLGLGGLFLRRRK